MTQIAPLAQVQPDPVIAVSQHIHPDWLSSWAPNLRNSKLLSQMHLHPGTSQRVIKALAPELSALSEQDSAALEMRCVALVEKISGDNLENVGMAFYAPRLVKCLFSQETRNVVGEMSHENMAMIRTYADHCRMEDLPPVPDRAALPAEGMKCFVSWMERQPEDVYAYLRLRLPKTALTDRDRDELRCTLMSKILEPVTAKAVS